ncbi:DUF624 domain-containing protein [Ornithinibacillus sp. L9]|uniref:DUF624 domain-containing protein n=1 Tax=Ornithinibacillus caprae TaxID=2678566 RepID=A0A6N8FJ21_9BACI|nr:DUF624 domain-containing protein [Ornithinibacillus caprae]MUK89423.1 DUF624 domain-containing protein [Ornithinibacillus caprae]
MNYSGFMGGLFALAEWIMRFSVINMLWIVTNLPILLIVFMMILTPSNLAIVVQAVPLAILLPILFFPSLTAVFATVRDWILDKEQPSLVKAYWKHLTRNYKNSFFSGAILTLAIIIWVIDFNYFKELDFLLGLLMFIVGVALYVYIMNYVSLSVHYVMSKKELFKNALLITIGNPLLFFSVLLGNSLLYYLSFRIWFLFLFFTISVSAFLTFFAFFRFTLRVEGKAAKLKSR